MWKFEILSCAYLDMNQYFIKWKSPIQLWRMSLQAYIIRNRNLGPLEPFTIVNLRRSGKLLW